MRRIVPAFAACSIFAFSPVGALADPPSLATPLDSYSCSQLLSDADQADASAALRANLLFAWAVGYAAASGEVELPAEAAAVQTVAQEARLACQTRPSDLAVTAVASALRRFLD
jgi:hypothetical protein